MKKHKPPPSRQNSKPLNAEAAQRILKEDGLEVSLEEAFHILELLREFARINVEHYILKNKKEGKP